MPSLTKKQRIEKILAHQPVDQIGLYEHFWDDTKREWTAQGLVKDDDALSALFNLEIREAGWVNPVAHLEMPAETIAEDAETITLRDGNYAILRRHKLHDTTPEHVGFGVTDRASWEKLVRPQLLELDRRRINFERYRRDKKIAAERDEFICWSTLMPFELMHPVCGHENMLLGMIDDPEWITDMCDVYSAFLIRHAECLFAEEGEPDGIWFYEDMGFKDRPFMSPDHYCEFLQPFHRRLCDWAHHKNKKVIMHSCGFIEPLLPSIIDAGIDCLQVIEVKAGMNLLRLVDKFRDKIAFCGGMDIRELYSNDKTRIDGILNNVLKPALENGASYILHTDHSVPHNVTPESLHYFQHRGIAISREVFGTR